MKQFEILSVKINTPTKKELLETIEERISRKSKTKLYTVNNEFIVEAQSNPAYRKVLNDADISIPDSTGVVWAIKKIYGETAERLPGADLFTDLLAIANQKKLGIFLLGGQKGVGETCKAKILSKFPQIRLVEYLDAVDINPNDQNQILLDEINKTKPELLFVALGSPKQETFIDRHSNEIDSLLMIGVGGTLDYFSGLVKRAPNFWRKKGLEWLYRLFKQPSRAPRIYNALIVFPRLIKKAERT